MGTEKSKQTGVPKGRMTIRKNASAQAAPNMKLWDVDAAPGTTVAKLEEAYLAALDVIDKLEAHRTAAAASGRFTEAGLMQDARRFALAQLAPALHRGRLEIQAAKKEAAESRAKLTLQPTDRTDLVGAMRRASTTHHSPNIRRQHTKEIKHDNTQR
jgi:hypothetical protein